MPLLTFWCIYHIFFYWITLSFLLPLLPPLLSHFKWTPATIATSVLRRSLPPLASHHISGAGTWAHNCRPQLARFGSRRTSVLIIVANIDKWRRSTPPVEEEEHATPASPCPSLRFESAALPPHCWARRPCASSSSSRQKGGGRGRSDEQH